MEILNHYFSEGLIINIVAKYRIDVASKRHEIHIYNDIRAKHLYKDPVEKTKNSIDEIIFQIIPPRRSWVKFRDRSEFKNATTKNIASIEKKIYLYKKVLKRQKTLVPDKWYLNLKAYVTDIRKTIININAYSIDPPKILPEKKDKIDKTDRAFRPIANYTSLKDKIIIGQAAKYLTDILDSEFCNQVSFAFRSRKNLANAITHHDAINKILSYIEDRKGCDLWVAECDIKKFYDCVNHRIAMESLNEIVQRAEGKGKIIDKRAIRIFELYLASYSFYHDVYPLNNTEMKKLNGFYKWEEQELIKTFYPSGINERIGVPQGGAISCLIANLILDKVDRKVIEVNKEIDNDLLYIRYCDDMIIIHPDRKKCNMALERYQMALHECNLLSHKPNNITLYESEYWNYKSKSPYKWSKKELGNATVPWLGFVGYQIRYDGLIRIRKKSVQKELKKQEIIVRKVLKAIDYEDKLNLHNNARRTSRQILFRAEQKLISMSVGRVQLYNMSKITEPQLSWTVGFKSLHKNNIIEKQLKTLDRGRMKQLNQLRLKLKVLNKTSGEGNDDIPNIYYGSPFSYHNFIIHKKNEFSTQLVNNKLLT